MVICPSGGALLSVMQTPVWLDPALRCAFLACALLCCEPRSGALSSHARSQVHPSQHQVADRAAGAGDPAAPRRRVDADLAEDGGGTGTDERPAPLLGLC